MQWVFDALVGWILEKLTGCFSVISGQLFTFFNLNREVFDSFFSFFGTTGNKMAFSLYDTFRYIGFAICILIVLVRLLGNLLSVVTEEYEDPIKLALRGIGAFVLVAISGSIVDLEFQFMSNPYSAVKKMMTKELKSYGSAKDFSTVWSGFKDALSNGLADTGGDSVVMDIITIGLLISIFFAFLKLSLEVAERYVVICVSLYMAPLAFSTAASKSTSKIMSAYIRMVFCQLLLMIFNVIFVDGTIIAIHNYVNSAGVLTINNKSVYCSSFIFCILLLAFITVGQKMDAYMRGLGLDTVQTGSLFDEIRGGMLNAMMLGRGLGEAAHAAGGVGRAVANGFRAITGRAAPGSMGGRHGQSNPVKETVANAGRSAAATVAQSVSQKNSSLQPMAQKAAQSQIRSGAFNGLMGEASKSIQKATETAIGAATMAKMGIDPASLVGKNGMINFKTQSGATGSLSFDRKDGNGWKELKDENGESMNAWVKGSSNLGISSAHTGTHESLSKAFGAEAGMKLGEKVGNRVDPASLEAISLGNGEFSIVGQNANGMSQRLGRIVPAEVGEKIAGASMLENEFGGKVGFLPEMDTAGAMNGKYVDDGLISLSGGISAPSDMVKDALAPAMEANNIAEGTAMLGFEASGDTFTASFADPVTGTKEISGNVNDLMSEIGNNDLTVGLSDGSSASLCNVQDALAPAMEANDVSDGSSLIGFSTSGDTYTASFADPINGNKDISGNVNDLINKMDPKDIKNGDISSNEWVGMNNLFDTNAYSAMTGETPKSVEYSGLKEDKTENGTYGFVVTNESGSKYILDQAAATGKYDKVISGGEMFDNVPLSIQRVKENGNPSVGDNSKGYKDSKKNQNSRKNYGKPGKR